MQKLQSSHGKTKRILFIVTFAVVGISSLLFAFAAAESGSISLQAESGVGITETSIINDATASSSSYVVFKETPTGGSDCPNAQHTPGGPDGAGGCWPYAGNTGPAASVNLTNYTGPCTITSTTVIDSKNITCDGIVVKGDLTIRNSNIKSYFDNDYGFNLTIEDSFVNGGNVSAPAIGYGNLIIKRSEVIGGQHNILCASNCVIEDNWLHGQYNQPGGSFHNNAYISNGGSSHYLRHNSFFCSPPDNGTGGGCTADASIFGDFATMQDVTFDFNLFHATPSGGVCGTFGYNKSKPFGNNPSNIDVVNNVFQRGPNNKCGVNAPVTSFLDANGSVWVNNTFADGVEVGPAGD